MRSLFIRNVVPISFTSIYRQFQFPIYIDIIYIKLLTIPWKVVSIRSHPVDSRHISFWLYWLDPLRIDMILLLIAVLWLNDLGKAHWIFFSRRTLCLHPDIMAETLSSISIGALSRANNSNNNKCFKSAIWHVLLYTIIS